MFISCESSLKPWLIVPLLLLIYFFILWIFHLKGINMKNLNREKLIAFRLNKFLKKHKIKATLEQIESLSKIIKKSIEFNQKLYDIGTLDGVSLATTVEDLMEVFMLRSEVYREMNYSSEFPEIIEGLDFDEYDEHSAIVYSRKGHTITGTFRLIFDSSDKKLPIDKRFSLDYLRNSNRNLVEASRVIIRDIKGLQPEFKLLIIDAYKILTSYNLDAIFVIVEDHLKLYINFGGLTVEKKFHTYGTLNKEFIITLWKTSEISPFFKRAFLQNVEVA